MNKISILLPTRKRPAQLNKAITSLVDLAEMPENLEFILAVDDDDTATEKFIKSTLDAELTAKQVSYIALSYPRLGYARLHDYINSMATRASGDWLILFNDDAVMKTPGWDREIHRYDGKFLCLAFDTHNHHPYSIFPIIPKAWADYLGEITNHSMFDATISQIAYMLNIMERTSIKVDHERHDLVGTVPDETYQERKLLEGDTSNPGDINHRNNIIWRTNAANKLSRLLESREISTEFWQKVKQGQQNPWEYLRLNDINNQMYTFESAEKTSTNKEK